MLCRLFVAGLSLTLCCIKHTTYGMTSVSAQGSSPGTRHLVSRFFSVSDCCVLMVG
jgi:hypothetical protein